MTTFKAGDKVKVVNYPEHVRNGMEATIAPILGTEDNPTTYFINFDDTVSLWMQTRYLELITAAPQDEYAGMSLEEQVAVLTEELYQVSCSYVAASKHRDMLQYDLTFFTDTMRDVKDVEGWCDGGTNTIIDQLNNGFQTHYIEPYQQEFEVDYEITASVTYSGTYTVMASSQDAANEFFSDDPESYITPEDIATEAVTYGGWDHCNVEVI